MSADLPPRMPSPDNAGIGLMLVVALVVLGMVAVSVVAVLVLGLDFGLG